MKSLKLSFRFFGRKNRYERAVGHRLAELYRTVHEGEQGMVFAKAYVFTWMVDSAPLANKDVACDGLLAAEYFNAKAFAVRFAAVPGTTRAFLVSHFLLLRT